MPSKKIKYETLPILPLRGLMVFPHMVLHFDVGRPKSLAALESAMTGDQQVFLVAQYDADEDNPSRKDCCAVGTVSRVKQVLKLPGDNIRVLVEGISRAKLRNIVSEDPFLLGEITHMQDRSRADTLTLEALLRTTQQFFDAYAHASGRISNETLASVGEVEDPAKLADIIAANVLTRLEDRQHILELADIGDRLEALCGILARETELTGIEKQVQARVKQQVEKNQKDYFLREQIKAIQTELGDHESTDVEDLREKLEKTPLNDEARERAQRELDRLSRMAPGSPEITVSRTYVEWILELPWGKESKDDLDLARARRILDEDHYGLKDVKERIVEYLAVRRIKQDMRGPILCLVGPPGVGKTSIAKSVARAIGRKFVQMSLGGVRDEAEIRGHRRTYIGAIPGRILSGIKQAGTLNPVFLFDEIDKMANDSRGDPASAMLEVLDSEQNVAFRDHYLDLPFDLSHVLFLTTANTVDTIPPPLLDRMEMIEISSYTEVEKLQIAKRHLLPKQMAQNGIGPKALKLSEKALATLINGYTREAGVRKLENVLAKICRKAVCRMVEEKLEQLTITPPQLETYLGQPRYHEDQAEKLPAIGVVNGLAYTPVGGVTLQVETAVLPGTGMLELTGQLGDVMKESAKAALSYVRVHAQSFGLSPDFYKTQDLHIHVPEGAVPKDGPSAGVTLATSLVSALTGIPARQDLAMTGEITLRGRVLPIGGLKEKLLAAHRAGIRTVLIPRDNMKDLEEVPDQVREKLEIEPVDQIDQVLAAALTRKPSIWMPTPAPSLLHTEGADGH